MPSQLASPPQISRSECARLNWQKSIATNWPQHVKPRALFVSKDFGETWSPIAAGLPAMGWINVVKEHPKNAEVLFAGTETGLFVSLNAGANWTRFTHGFPTVPVDDIVIHPRDGDLVVGTHGRSIYVLDDISPLSGMTAAVAALELHLFPPRPATVLQRWKPESYSAQRVFAGPNPPFGAILTYHVKTAAKAPAAISIRSAAGALVRELEGTLEAGRTHGVSPAPLHVLRTARRTTMPTQGVPSCPMVEDWFEFSAGASL